MSDKVEQVQRAYLKECLIDDADDILSIDAVMEALSIRYHLPLYEIQCDVLEMDLWP